MPERFSRFRYLRTAAQLAVAAFREGRLTASPRRWLLDLRHLRKQMAGGFNIGAHPARLPSPGGSAWKAALLTSRRAALTAFINSGTELRFERPGPPLVSVLLVVYNRAELTLRCLQALHEQQPDRLELVIVDNNSTDETPTLLARVQGAHVLCQNENLGFIRATNLAARAARGEYLLLLNSDTEVRPGSIEAALEMIQSSASVGAVGGRLVFPDGRLQEAGSIIWNDGSCLGYGRDDSPWNAEYSFVRDVDFCSAAFLLTPRQLFLALGCLDERYQPAYYEDADYCVRLWKAGKRVVYAPRAVVEHFEFGSSPSASDAVDRQLQRRATFVEAHRDWLVHQAPPSVGAVLRARDRRSRGLRILLVDDRVPHTTIGFGYPRAVALVRALAELGHFVSLLPLAVVAEDWTHVYDDIPGEVEVLLGYGPHGVAEFFHKRRTYYDRIIVSRSHNMGLLRARLGDPGAWSDHARIIYDAEALSASREIERRRLSGEVIGDAEAARLTEAELALVRGVDAVMAVSAGERKQFEHAAPGRVHIVRHAVDATPTLRPFDERDGILFVGSFHELSPNADAAIWFATEVLPLLRERMGQPVRLTIVGEDPPNAVLKLRGDGVDIVGRVRDLGPLYDGSRLFVAPTRFAAGIPLKIIHAAAYGVPVVATSLLARQLDWRHRCELLVADSREEFASACVALHHDATLWHGVRTAALARVRDAYSADAFKAALRKALSPA